MPPLKYTANQLEPQKTARISSLVCSLPFHISVPGQTMWYIHSAFYLLIIYSPSGSYQYHVMSDITPPPYQVHPTTGLSPAYCHTYSPENMPYKKVNSSQGGHSRKCGHPKTKYTASTPMVVSMVMLMVCFVVATPFSLLLTIPAYILADKVRIS